VRPWLNLQYQKYHSPPKKKKKNENKEKTNSQNINVYNFRLCLPSIILTRIHLPVKNTIWRLLKKANIDLPIPLLENTQRNETQVNAKATAHPCLLQHLLQ
jgi:hypothetical protein